jgi:hypothetical protein
MISGLLTREDLHLRAESACFFCYQGADAVHRGFVVRGRFGFHEKLEE